MLIYYRAVLPAQKTWDPIQNNGKTVILMALFIAMALVVMAFTPLAIRMAFTPIAVRMALMPLGVILAFVAIAVRMAFGVPEARMAFMALAIHGQDISMERFIQVVATLLPIKG